MRLYNPDDFGLFALFGALNMTFVAVASGRYELAIVMAKTEEDAANLLALTLAIVRWSASPPASRYGVSATICSPWWATRSWVRCCGSCR